ncbi:MAG: bifunctional diaminohydroxyphosphoribosylaminopyrimidine deaminase/5-amino-6-(5-phosphoribosylamino)uracil reductase RibD [Candidatus Omnitrophica bacterium]|nr:bifunctional diaminohydroxyphosphoribosylaminopyrimidine deaminase/5-amino-6-(5-phosphoribosylamino)uracil reductase RibD [Candidatus Omnitrophota bacterium]
MFTQKDTKYMKTALALAAKAKERTYPNPMVGAVIVKNGRIIGEGYHRKAGLPHAEVNAIRRAGKRCVGADMYITLEPCDHYGKTPPCTKAIIENGIRRVTFGMRDPNPITAGKGIERLKKAGIRVKIGLCKNEAERLNRKYIKFITKRLPYVTLKLAQSLDGKIAARDGSSKWISSEDSRMFVRRMRSDYDAILIGAGTAVKDDPCLLAKGGKGRNPLRIVVDSRLKMSLTSNLIKTAAKAPVLIATTHFAPTARIKKFSSVKGVEVIKTDTSKGRVALRALLKLLAEKGIVNILSEGGSALAGSLFDEALVDEIIFFISPKIIGGEYTSVRGNGVKNIKNVIKLENVEYQVLGEDILARGSVKY